MWPCWPWLLPSLRTDKGLFLHELYGRNSQQMIILGPFWHKNEALIEVNRLHIQQRQEKVFPCPAHLAGKLCISSLHVTRDAASSPEFLKVVGVSCLYFSRNNALHTEMLHPVLHHPEAQIAGDWERTAPGQDCFPAPLGHSGARPLQPAQPLAGRRSRSVTCGRRSRSVTSEQAEAPAWPAAASPALLLWLGSGRSAKSTLHSLSRSRSLNSVFANGLSSPRAPL